MNRLRRFNWHAAFLTALVLVACACVFLAESKDDCEERGGKWTVAPVGRTLVAGHCGDRP